MKLNLALFLREFQRFFHPGIGGRAAAERPCEVEELRKSFLPPKSQTHLFWDGRRKGISVYRGTTLGQPVCWALSSHLHPNPVTTL